MTRFLGGPAWSKSWVVVTLVIGASSLACGSISSADPSGTGGSAAGGGLSGGGGGASPGGGAGGASGAGGAFGSGGVDAAPVDGSADGSPGNDGSGDGTIQCGATCPAGTWDLDGNPATGVCGCEYSCNKVSDADPIDPSFADDNCDGTDGVVAQCVLVSATLGSIAGAGTREQPIVTIARGIDIARAKVSPRSASRATPTARRSPSPPASASTAASTRPARAFRSGARPAR